MLRIRFIVLLLAFVVLAACRIVPEQQFAATPAPSSPQAANVPAITPTPPDLAPSSFSSAAPSPSSSAAAALPSDAVVTSTDTLVFTDTLTPTDTLAFTDTLSATESLSTTATSLALYVPLTQSAAPTETPVAPVDPPAPPAETLEEPTATPDPVLDPPLPPTDTPAAPSSGAPPSDALPTDTPVPGDAPPSDAPPSDAPPGDVPPVETPVVPSNAPAPTPPPSATSPASGENSFARGTITARPWAVMIDNYPAAWPQSGINDASLVFEALAEGGITRFMAVFTPDEQLDVPEIGPVRSARVYFVQWAMGLGAVFMHAGGSPDGLELARSTDQIVNAEALTLPQYARRDTGRAAPHNLYTSSDALRTFAAEQRPLAADQQLGYLFDRIAPAETPQATRITYDFSQTLFQGDWRYDRETNGYYRSSAGGLQVDRAAGDQLWTRNLVVMEVPSAARPGDTAGRIDVQVIGSGAARFFFAGQQIEGTWEKADAAAPLVFRDAQGQEIVFNLGSMWVAAVPTLDNLVVQ